ncbi:MAG: chemotaxis protein CheX [Polyangiaceae bacterium]|nr:chemotaxis protein CheX [Polyangiaceae bacterium]
MSAEHLHLIVKASTVELLGSYGVAVAPQASGSGSSTADPTSMLTGLIDFRSPGFSGRMTLSVTRDLATATSGEHGGTTHGTADWVRELTNQLMGKLKTRLARFGLKVQAGLPSAAAAGAFSGQATASSEQFQYSFRSLKGEVLVALVGQFDLGAIDYANASAGDDPKDLILF